MRFYDWTAPESAKPSLCTPRREMKRAKKKSWFILKLIQHSNKLYIDALRFNSEIIFFVVFFSSVSCVLKTSFKFAVAVVVLNVSLPRLPSLNRKINNFQLIVLNLNRHDMSWPALRQDRRLLSWGDQLGLLEGVNVLQLNLRLDTCKQFNFQI